jgi:transposase-like protein
VLVDTVNLLGGLFVQKTVLSEVFASVHTKAMKSDKSIYCGRHFSPVIIGYAVWIYHRFSLSLRDVENLLAERGISVSYETIRAWCKRYGPEYASRIR